MSYGVRVAKVFLSQNALEEWVAQEKVDLSEGKLVVPAEAASFPAVPAVHFVKLVSGADSQKLVSTVKTSEQLEILGAEHMADSVLLGETAYEVVPGYLAEVPNPPTQQSTKKAVAPETDLLAAFLLDKIK